MYENNNGVNKSVINWYPGHMAKTKKLIKEKYKLIDIVYEIIDARIPYSSKIIDIDELLQDKPRILIMNKSDLCDLKETLKWQSYYEKQGYNVLLVNLNHGNDYQKIITKTYEIMTEKLNNRKQKGLTSQEIRALVIGIPNVGKSTLINKMAGKKVANIGNKPGVTTSLSWLKTKSNILILDTPGILYPKIKTPEIGLNLASMGSIKEEILPLDEVAIHILNKLNSYYPDILKEEYNLEKLDEDAEIVYNHIGHKIGALISGGEIDYEKVSKKIINDIKSEKIKNITFDRKDD